VARRFPSTFYNPLSIISGVLSLICFISIVFLILLGIFVPQTPVYFGIITYIVLPSFLFIGLLFVLIGFLRERHRLLQGGEERPFIAIDFRNPKHRRGLTVSIIVIIVFMLASAFGSYQAFEYSESVVFCGKVCHNVMEPEYTAYQNSPHARVRCAECHIGAGADWFVKSKLSGAYQVYAVIANVYPTPIPTPIKNLRPAQETCERCHWPQHFFSEKKWQKTYYKKDEKNSPWTISMLMKIGGGTSEFGPTEGIHWYHLKQTVQYIYTDSMRQQIPWVQTIDKDGKTTTYISEESDLSAEQIANKQKFKADCIDCHNRPSHVYRAPTKALDQSMSVGKINPVIPNIKSIAVDLLTVLYPTKEKAFDSIRTGIRNYYQSNYKSFADSNTALLSMAVDEIQKIYGRNFFPKMHVSWKAYPENIGHMTNNGCFRCHDGKHKSPEGKVIPKNCNTCHTILYQGPSSNPQTLQTAGLEFQHPEDIGDEWKTTNCSECHTGD
jgi:hypothetical protein